MHKKVLQLIGSSGLYGAENVVLNLSTGLKKGGVENHIGCFYYRGQDKPPVGRHAEALGFTTVYFTSKNKFDFTCIRDIAAYCWRNHISVIHSHGYKTSGMCLLIRLFYGIPYVITCHLLFPNLKRFFLYYYLEQICMVFAEKVIGVSEEIVHNLGSGLVPKSKLQVIDNGIDTEATANITNYDPQKLRAELGFRNDSLLIGSLGRLTEQKDYKTFIVAAARILGSSKNCEFFIAGDGNLREELLQAAQQYGIEKNFHFLGYRKDTVNLLKLMDIFVLSSLDEGLPMAMLEAMAAGLPIVVTRVGGIPQVVINDHNGLVVDKGNPQQLADALAGFLQSSDKRKQIGANARKTILGKYSLDKMTEKHIALYNSLV